MGRRRGEKTVSLSCLGQGFSAIPILKKREMRSFDFLLWKSCESVLYCLWEKRQGLLEASGLGEQGIVATSGWEALTWVWRLPGF